MTTKEMAKVGGELVAASKKVQRTPGEILQELFPFVYEASRRMSAREISRWLQENYNVQISQPTISRALRDPRDFWTGFTETIEPAARRVASSLGVTMKHLLLDDGFNSECAFGYAYEAAKDSLSKEELADVDEGIQFLRETWFSLSAGTRRACAPYLGDDEYLVGEYYQATEK